MPAARSPSSRHPLPLVIAREPLRAAAAPLRRKLLPSFPPLEARRFHRVTSPSPVPALRWARLVLGRRPSALPRQPPSSRCRLRLVPAEVGPGPRGTPTSFSSSLVWATVTASAT